jgi:ribosomal protein S18 acetylase RimI-like enzyme
VTSLYRRSRVASSSLATAIQALLKSTGQLQKVPNRSTIDERLGKNQYIVINAAPSNGPRFFDSAGNAISVNGTSAESTQPTLAGVVMVRKLNWYLAEIRHLAVIADFRGHGVAEALVALAEDKARSMGARMVQATVQDDNEVLSEILGGAGWNEGPFFENSRTGHDLTVYTKVL